MEALIHIGTILATSGLKGQVKAKIFLDSFKNINDIYPVYINNKSIETNISFIRLHKNNKIISLKSVNTIEKAKTLIGKKLFIERKMLPKIKSGEYYFSDIVGFTIKLINNKKLGIVKNILNFGAGDILEVQLAKNKSILVPIDNNTFKKVNLKTKTIIINVISGIL